MKKVKVKKAVQEDTYPKVIETFKEFGNWEMERMKQEEPSCFNGVVRVKRYKVTIEEIEEPKEVIIERLQKIWDETTNYHHTEPLRRMAAQYGHEFQGWLGSKKKK